MAILIDESIYSILKNNDPSYQAMVRISDSNNIYDVEQTYVKDLSNNINDYQSQLNTFDKNVGILCDGKHIDLVGFFTNYKENITMIGGTPNVTYEFKNIEYFKFKANIPMYFESKKNIEKTYVSKINKELIYERIKKIDGNGKETIVLGDKKVVEKEYSSRPLHRLDLLAIYELPSFFIYQNGKKLPDNEIYIYNSGSFTDIFIPKSYVIGIDDPKVLNRTDVFSIDYRQPGSEVIRYRDTPDSDVIIIDLTDEKYKFSHFEDKMKIENVLAFKNGELIKPLKFERNDNILTIEFKDITNQDIELYLLNDVVYRYKPGSNVNVNNNKNKMYFYIDDNYITDVISGPITKHSISLFYDSKRVLDSKITQTSRFSFECDININDFDENKLDFIIEDIGKQIADKEFKTYGDDYYLMNMLGVKRCVDSLNNYKSYSIFDESQYNINFKKILSNEDSTTKSMYDLEETIKRYKVIDKSIDTVDQRIKNIIKYRPSLLRKLMENYCTPFKKYIILGNNKDFTISSINKIDFQDYNKNNKHEYYKIYVNRKQLDRSKYTVTREYDTNIITINKSVFEPYFEDPVTHKVVSGENIVELYQFETKDYKNNILILQTENNSESSDNWEKFIDTDGTSYYEKTIKLKDLPFPHYASNEDICALEIIEKEWFSYHDKEFYYKYTNTDNVGFLPIKKFEIIERNNEEIKFRVALNYGQADKNPNCKFYLIYKEFNVIHNFMFTNEDKSYMKENDLLIPIGDILKYHDYSTGTDKSYQNSLPYIHNRFPNITCNGIQLKYGSDYSYIHPCNKTGICGSFIIFRKQYKVGDVFSIHFASKDVDNVLLFKDNLDISNRYGLVYLSALRYPFSPKYMKVIINGIKIVEEDIDILSDKLIRIHNITRPINSIVIYSNLKYSDNEFDEYINTYVPTTFEKTIEKIFRNCDPNKIPSKLSPNVDMVYKVSEFYPDFIGNITNYDNDYYNWYIKTIKKKRYEIKDYTLFHDICNMSRDNETLYIKATQTTDEEKEKYNQATEFAKKFFNIYSVNWGFVPEVDSVLQTENKYYKTPNFNWIDDIMEVMYVNWLTASGKTRSYGFKDRNIDKFVLQYFNTYEHDSSDGRCDIVVDSNKMYDGMLPYVQNNTHYWDFSQTPMKEYVVYPGAEKNTKRRFFYEMLLRFLKGKKSEDNISYLHFDNNTIHDVNTVGDIIHELSYHRFSNKLYPPDYPLHPDSNGIRWTGSDMDIVNIKPD